LNFPQYLSYLFTKKITSDFTYPGCHTATWDFDNMQYHNWLQQEGITLPEPLPGNTTFPVTINGKTIRVGIGIHDSSASLIPWFRDSQSPFILCSTGTWCVMMNPFNPEPLTLEQLQNGCLCYLSTDRKSVKSSLLFMGHIHDVNVKRLTGHYRVAADAYKRIQLNRELLDKLQNTRNPDVFFKAGIPPEYTDDTVDLSQFTSFEHAYHQFMMDITRLAFTSLKMIIAEKDDTRTLFVSGGFNRNLIFIHLLQQWLPHINVIPSEVKNATALGAALIIKSA
jgi:sugar (pentulose or hexulose) kinase